jgi:hypothetical protein
MTRVLKTYEFRRTINHRSVVVGEVKKFSDGTASAEYVNWGGVKFFDTPGAAFGTLRHSLANADACNAWDD